MFSTLLQHHDLIRDLTLRELKIKYRGSALGLLWSMLTPLLLVGVYYFFLSRIAGRATPLTEIVIGVFAWQFTVQGVMGGLSSITDNANLVKKVALPRVILPLTSTLGNLLNYLLTFAVQIPVLLLLGLNPGWPLLLLPLALGLHLLFTFGLALLTSAVNVYFRDLQHLIGVVLTAWFFVTPAMYNTSFPEFRDNPQLMANPMAVIIEAYRYGFGYGSEGLRVHFCDYGWIGLVLIPLTFLAGTWTFRRAQKNFADYL